MNENDKPTPRPWLGLYDSTVTRIVGPESATVCREGGSLSVADLKLIIRAVNCHDELMAACEAIVTNYDGDDDLEMWANSEALGDMISCAQAIVAKAKGEA